MVDASELVAESKLQVVAASKRFGEQSPRGTDTRLTICLADASELIQESEVGVVAAAKRFGECHLLRSWNVTRTKHVRCVRTHPREQGRRSRGSEEIR